MPSEDREMPGSVQDHEATVIEALEAMLAWTHVPPVTPLIQVKRDQIETALANFRRASGPVDPAEHEGQRWTIYKRSGEWDDVIEGPDTGETHDGGIDVVPAAELARVRAEQQTYSETYARNMARVRAERDEADRQWRFELERFKAAEARCASIRTEMVARVRSMPLGYRPQDVADELEAEFSAPVQADTEETNG